MGRLVDEDDVIDIINFECGKWTGLSKTIEKEIKALTSAQPKRPKGRWIEYDNSHCECPFCHEEWSYFDNEVEHFDFCPKCGADLRGKQDEQENNIS